MLMALHSPTKQLSPSHLCTALHRVSLGAVGQGAPTNFYNYNAFPTAAAAFPAFATSSPDPAVNLRELMAFLAQSSHETTGGWATAPGGPYAWGLCCTNEGECCCWLGPCE